MIFVNITILIKIRCCHGVINCTDIVIPTAAGSTFAVDDVCYWWRLLLMTLECLWLLICFHRQLLIMFCEEECWGSPWLSALS